MIGGVSAAVAPSRAVMVVAAALALAALSLLLPWALAFDPQMWVVWGRDVTRLGLDTRAGPSWKPLPVLLTTPFALAGDAAPALWLVVARAGALLALAAAWTLGRRLGGTVAGAAAAGAMALSPWWLPNGALGNSEGMLAAAVLWAVIAHLDGHRRAAVLLGLAAALLRPEAWPFLFAYGLWAWRADPRTRPVLLLAAVAVPVLWIGPDVWGGGGGLGASNAARGEPSEGSAARADVPLLAVLADAATIAGIPVLACALAAIVALPGSPPSRTVRLLAAGGVAWVAIVAAMTAGGFAGNPRYLVAGAAVLAVLGGIGAARVVAAARLPAAVALLLPLAVGAIAFSGLRDKIREAGVRADRRTALPRLVAAAGGRDALLGCGPVRTAPFVRGLVAWTLDVTPWRIDARPVPPGSVLRIRTYDGAEVLPANVPPQFRRRAAVPGWEALEACGG
jgi:hypothetical protein